MNCQKGLMRFKIEIGQFSRTRPVSFRKTLKSVGHTCLLSAILFETALAFAVDRFIISLTASQGNVRLDLQTACAKTCLRFLGRVLALLFEELQNWKSGLRCWILFLLDLPFEVNDIV